MARSKGTLADWIAVTVVVEEPAVVAQRRLNASRFIPAIMRADSRTAALAQETVMVTLPRA